MTPTTVNPEPPTERILSEWKQLDRKLEQMNATGIPKASEALDFLFSLWFNRIQNVEVRR